MMAMPMPMPMALNDDGLAGIDMIMPDQQFEFDHEAFDTLLQQVQEDYDRGNPFCESFEFSEFVADYY